VKARSRRPTSAPPISKARYTVGELVNRQTGEVLLEANKPLTAEMWATMAEAGITGSGRFASPSATTWASSSRARLKRTPSAPKR
jgi:hypothetical protein